MTASAGLAEVGQPIYEIGADEDLTIAEVWSMIFAPDARFKTFTIKLLADWKLTAVGTENTSFGEGNDVYLKEKEVELPPKTGDSANLTLWAALTLLSAAAPVTLTRKQRRC